MDRPLLSVCLIARDEEASIGACLDAVRSLAGEIVVADTGSRDRTAEVAAARGARVVRFAWCDDFAAARNACLDAATGAWILVLDADERLAPCAPATLEALVRAGRAPAYTVEVRSDTGGGRVEVAHITRLFENRAEHRYTGRIHEQILPAIARAAGDAGFVPPRSGLVVEHLGYTPEMRAARGKLERNRRLLRAEIDAQPDEPGWRFLYAKETTPGAGGDLLDLPEAREAHALLEPAARRIADGASPMIADAALALAARLALVCGAPDDAARHLAALERACGRTARWCYARGELLLATGEAREAGAMFLAAATAPDAGDALPAEALLRGAWGAARAAAAALVAGEAWRPVEDAVEGALLGALAACRGGQPGEALGLLAPVVQVEAGDPRLWWALARTLTLAGQREPAERMLETARRAAPGWTAARDARATPRAGLLALFG